MTEDTANAVIGHALTEINRMEPCWPKVREAIFSGHIDLARNPRRANEMNYALSPLVSAGPPDLFFECIDKGMPVFPNDAYPYMALDAAIRNGRLENLAHLLKAHPIKKWMGTRRLPFPDPLYTWTFGTPLYRPAFDNNIWSKSLKMLIDAGCDLERRDQWGRTPLLMCLILHLGAMLGMYWKNNESTSFAKKEYIERALLLIAAGADVNAKMQRKSYEEGGNWPIGATPLFARPYGDGRIHRALLKAGADPLIECLKPVPWNAIEFAEMHLERLGQPPGEYVHPRTKKRLSLDEGKSSDGPEQVRSVIAMMRRAAAKIHRK